MTVKYPKRDRKRWMLLALQLDWHVWVVMEKSAALSSQNFLSKIYKTKNTTQACLGDYSTETKVIFDNKHLSRSWANW